MAPMQPKNFHADGGNRWVVGGELVVEPGATVTGIDTGGGSVAWDDVTDKPAVIGAGATQAAARTAIGAGTSSLAIGTTGSTAAAGNHVHTAAVVTVAAGTDGLSSGNVQATLQALATRIAVLEAAAA